MSYTESVYDDPCGCTGTRHDIPTDTAMVIHVKDKDGKDIPCEYTEDETYQCLQCGRDCCWCFGQDDLFLDYCDDCVAKGISTEYIGEE